MPVSTAGTDFGQFFKVAEFPGEVGCKLLRGALIGSSLSQEVTITNTTMGWGRGDDDRNVGEFEKMIHRQLACGP
jgi:hypothetical protein